MNKDDHLIYLATPYSHPNPNISEHRFNVINRVAAALMEHGLFIYSPISHTHPIALAGNLLTDWNFWQQYDTVILRRCNLLVIVTQSGWRESKGVKGETDIAIKLGIPIRYLSVNAAMESPQEMAAYFKETVYYEKVQNSDTSA